MNEPILTRAIAALEPVGDRLVLIGGGAHRLFPLHPYGEELEHELLTTEDIDFAAPLRLAYAGDEDLVARLETAGFHEEVRGAKHPCHRYRYGDRIETLQFVAPLAGSGRKRSGERDRALRFSGIVAEKLRSVDLLLDAPWALRIDEAPTASLHVVNPLAFLAQKLLILPTRSFAKRGKDALYVHDTLSIFGERLDELRAESSALLPRIKPKQTKAVRQSIERFFETAGDAAREAARIAASQRADPPTTDSIARACRDGLEVLFA